MILLVVIVDVPIMSIVDVLEDRKVMEGSVSWFNLDRMSWVIWLILDKISSDVFDNTDVIILLL